MTAPTAHHVGVTVADLDRMVEFYADALDFDVAARFDVAGDAFATAVAVADASAAFAHLDAGGCRLELVEYDPQGATREEGRLNQPGATHLGLQVDDVDAVYQSLPDDTTTLSEPRTTETGTRICFLRDPEGNLLELLDPDAA